MDLFRWYLHVYIKHEIAILTSIFHRVYSANPSRIQTGYAPSTGEQQTGWSI